MNLTLYKKEMKSSIKLLLILGAVITLYVAIIIGMYEEMSDAMLQFAEIMPDIMGAFGMSGLPDNLMEYMVQYLYGMLLLVIPLIFSVIRANSLVAKYVDKGGMPTLLSAPVKREKVAVTQAIALISGIVILMLYVTVLQIILCVSVKPDEFDLGGLLAINAGLLCLQLFIAGICFLMSCIFSETKYSAGLGAGITLFMFILQMLAQSGDKANFFKYLTFFSLFNPTEILNGNGLAIGGVFLMLILSAILFVSSVITFKKKDLYI